MKTRFIQIGNIAFNIASIARVDFGSTGSVRIEYGLSIEDRIVHLYGPAALAFREWWDKRAIVYYIDPTWFDESHLSDRKNEQDREE